MEYCYNRAATQESGEAKQSGILIACFSLRDNVPWERGDVDTTTSASAAEDMALYDAVFMAAHLVGEASQDHQRLPAAP